VRDERAIFPDEPERIGVMVPGITPADAHDPAALTHAHAVAKRAREFAGVPPVPVRLFQHPHLIVPHLFAALPWHAVGKIRAAGNEQRIAAHACEWCGDTQRVGKGRELAPLLSGAWNAQQASSLDHIQEEETIHGAIFR
jgi:hypothetical protein